MRINESVAALRGISATLYDAAGALLDPATSWSAGMVKVATSGGFGNAANLPVAVTGGDGAFDLALATTEVDELGSLRVRFYTAGGALLAEYSDTITSATPSYIAKDETDATARTIAASIYDLNGTALPAATSWSAGMVKVSKAGGAFANAANLPTSSGAAGDFSFVLSTGEVNTEGRVRVRFLDASANLLAEYVSDVRGVAVSATTTQAAIRDRVKALIEAKRPTSDAGVRFRSYRNEGPADFQTDMEKQASGALRRFQARAVGSEDPPEVSDTQTDLRHFDIVVTVAYPQNARHGVDQALDRDDVIDQDWGLLNGLIGIYGRANFSGSHDCTPLGAEKEIEKGAACDFLVVRARFSHYRTVT